jgi:formylglycine-generating enzyme required for sulfatase activity
MPDPMDPLHEYCTYLGPMAAANDRLPLNCVDWDTARAACRAEGGDLPTEARWEHAARGRGERRRFPWGDDEPEGAAVCCVASLSRTNPITPFILCTAGAGPEPVRSHPGGGASCGGLGDVSRDGVFDLGGSVSEMTLDHFRPYSDPCWAGGVLVDPVCLDPASTSFATRGTDWASGPVTAQGARRDYSSPGVVLGFRCVYEDAP